MKAPRHNFLLLTSHFLLAALALALSGASASAAVFRGVDDGRMLRNPGCGLAFYYYSNSPDAYGPCLAPCDDMAWFPGCSICYLRLPWSMVEPKEGVFDWATIDAPAQRWIARGGQIALRFTCSEDWMYYATPEWVRDAGAKGTQYRLWQGMVRTPDGKTLPWDPDFGDPVFLEKLETFVAALAARYDGRPEVAFVDIGSYGLWGEGHTFGSSQVPEEKRARDIPRHIDLWRKHFTKTPLLLSDDIDGNNNQSGDYPMLDYARAHGVGWRDDSILVEPPPRSWYHADQAERYWRTLPVALETEHYMGSVARGAWTRELLEKAVEVHHASTLSIHGDPKRLLDDNPEAFATVARRLGYRFLPREVAWPDAISFGKAADDFAVTFSFANAGVAPCYRDLYPCLTLKDAQGGIAAVLADGGFNLRGLLPDAPAAHNATFRLGRFGAPVLPEGTFDVFLSVGEADGTPVCELPLAGGDDGQRRYRIGTVELKSADPPPVKPIRVLLLGDSITHGSQSSYGNGYRAPLWCALGDLGYKIDFVGTQTDSYGKYDPRLGDLDHEGVSGIRIGQMIGRIDKVFDRVGSVDCVLLHIGTNEGLEGQDVFRNEATNRLVRLLDRLHDRTPGAKIVVTSLMPRWSTRVGDKAGNWQYEAITNIFNPAIPRIVETQRAKGQDAHFLDMHAAIGFEDLADSVHPNDAGYAKMADAWLGAFTNLFPKKDATSWTR